MHVFSAVRLVFTIRLVGHGGPLHERMLQEKQRKSCPFINRELQVLQSLDHRDQSKRKHLKR
jgi:hypothetical protein